MDKDEAKEIHDRIVSGPEKPPKQERKQKIKSQNAARRGRARAKEMTPEEKEQMREGIGLITHGIKSVIAGFLMMAAPAPPFAGLVGDPSASDEAIEEARLSDEENRDKERRKLQEVER